MFIVLNFRVYVYHCKRTFLFIFKPNKNRLVTAYIIYIIHLQPNNIQYSYRNTKRTNEYWPYSRGPPWHCYMATVFVISYLSNRRNPTRRIRRQIVNSVGHTTAIFELTQKQNYRILREFYENRPRRIDFIKFLDK